MSQRLVFLFLILLTHKYHSLLLNNNGRMLQQISTDNDENVQKLKEQHERRVQLIQQEIYEMILEKLPRDSPLRELSEKELTDKYNEFLRKQIVSQKDYHEYANEANQFFNFESNQEKPKKG